MSLGVHGCVTLGMGRGLFCSEELQGGGGLGLSYGVPCFTGTWKGVDGWSSYLFRIIGRGGCELLAALA